MKSAPAPVKDQAVLAGISARRRSRRPPRAGRGMGRHLGARLFSVALATAVATMLGGAALAAPAPSPTLTPTPPRISLRAAPGFYDDAWAVDAAGKRLALIHTDRETFQRLELFDLDGAEPKPKPVLSFEVSPPTRTLESVSFLPDGSGLLLVSAGDSDSHVLECAANDGKVLGRVAPVSAFGFATLTPAEKGRPAVPLPVLVAVEKRAATNGAVTQVVTPLRLPSLKPAGKSRRYVIGADGSLRPQALRAIGFFDGYSKLLTQRAGWYDKKKDVRQPDGRAVLDLLSGKTLADEPIEDVPGWARTSRLRREHPNRTVFIQLADAIPTVAGSAPPHGGSSVVLVDPTGGLASVPLAVPFRVYDRSTLNDQQDGGAEPATLHFAIQVDPVNPDAVAHKKADLPYLDLYTVPVAHPEAAHLRARVAVDSQPLVWLVGGNRLVVFRRFKSFARGGDHLDVYDLAL